MLINNHVFQYYSTNKFRTVNFRAKNSDSMLLDVPNSEDKLPDVDVFDRMDISVDGGLTVSNYNKITGKAHSDFYKISNHNLWLSASSYFRRGVVLGSNEGFNDVIKIFSLLFNEKNDDKKSMLIVGIGHSQEPFSYLAVIKELIKNKKLDDVLTLQTVDLQTKPTRNILLNCSHYDEYINKKPEFAKTSFVKYAQFYGDIFAGTGYRVNDEIFNYLYNTYNDANKSKWATRIQDEIKSYSDNFFDVLSINNVLGYIENDDEYYSTIKNLPRIIKPDGYLITDTTHAQLFKELGLDNSLKKISFGIYKKVAK